MLEPSSHPVQAELLRLLLHAVTNGKLFCPISAWTLIEILKQSDPVRRAAIVSLVDQLSRGVVLAQEEERMGTELAHFMYSQISPTSVLPRRWLVWHRIPFALGDFECSAPWLSASENLVLAKSMFDLLWEKSLAETVGAMGTEKVLPAFPLAELATKLNALNRQHAGDLRSYPQAYSREAVGMIDLLLPVARQIVLSMHRQLSGGDETDALDLDQSIERGMRAILYQAARKRRLANVLPTVHVIAHCHAAVRWDKRRQLKQNDLPDFHHAAAALPYARAFFTDGPLYSLVTRSDIAMHKEFDCFVTSDSECAVAFVQDLVQ